MGVNLNFGLEDADNFKAKGSNLNLEAEDADKLIQLLSKCKNINFGPENADRFNSITKLRGVISIFKEENADKFNSIIKQM
jgi:hypothetical protein